ncbi:hypothetical protein WUBG_09047 [Wuchereria bancrofti]|uniref:Uncharacterized protein n=1 Tax=Wuchereria bancrofti TaxID=6293 RepID=J9ESJ9_WUCBA|nr:hypothetical protein WUBG_09047 [Wuchereria bancrofti]
MAIVCSTHRGRSRTETSNTTHSLLVALNAMNLKEISIRAREIYRRLQEGDEAAYQPKGLKLWKAFEVTQKTNKTASSLATQ